MLCPRCATNNRPDARFCRACGLPLAGRPHPDAPAASWPDDLAAAAGTDGVALAAPGGTAVEVPPGPSPLEIAAALAEAPAEPPAEEPGAAGHAGAGILPPGAEAGSSSAPISSALALAASPETAVPSDVTGTAVSGEAAVPSLEDAATVPGQSPILPSPATPAEPLTTESPGTAVPPDLAGGAADGQGTVPGPGDAAPVQGQSPVLQPPPLPATEVEGVTEFDTDTISLPAVSAPVEAADIPDSPAAAALALAVPADVAPAIHIPGVPQASSLAEPVAGLPDFVPVDNDAMLKDAAPGPAEPAEGPQTEGAPLPAPTLRENPEEVPLSSPDSGAEAAESTAARPVPTLGENPEGMPLGSPDAGAGFAEAQESTAVPAESPGAALPTFDASAPTPFGTPPALDPLGEADQEAVHPPAGASAPLEAATETTAPMDGDREPVKLSEERATEILGEGETPRVAPPVPGEEFPALQPGTLIADRYQVEQVVQTGPQRQTYLAADLRGYLRCWACSSRDNIQGEQYCTECGAQLTGRVYRLFETPPQAPVTEPPPPVLDGKIAGLAMVYDAITDSTSGRHYLVLDDVGGRPLSAVAADAETPPGDERVLGWLHQAAELLRETHAGGVVGCDFTPQALHVLPDDRVVLADPTACRLAGQVADHGDPATEMQADVRRVAAGLEQWYSSLTQKEPAAVSTGDGTLADVLAQGREGAYHTAADFAGTIGDLLTILRPPRDLQLVSGRATDVGVQRKLNEDSVFALEMVTMEAAGYSPLGLYIVADGMGGHDSGEVASSIAVRTIPGVLSKVLESRIGGESHLPSPDEIGTLLRQAILEANNRIVRLSQERHSDMGTTVTMALVVGNRVTIANVGDSRTYLWRDGKLHQVSEDHSLVARLIAAGQLTEEEGRHFDRRNEIYRALGEELHPEDIDIFQLSLRPLDALFLCSDGMWEMVRDEDMERIMLEAPDPPAAAQALIAAANAGGGADNISVIIAQTLTNSED